MYLGVLLVALVSVLVSVSAQHVRYVLPNGSSPDLNCPAQPCLTLDQYTQQTGTYFTAGATFLFLAGNHSLQAAVILTNISDVTLRGEGNANIMIHKNGVKIKCTSVTNLTIEQLSLMIYSYTTTTKFNIYPTRTSKLDISSSNNIRISDCIFHRIQGSRLVGAISLVGTSAEIINCAIYDINSSHGALYVRNSYLTISGGRFIGNRAFEGGAINLFQAHLVIKEAHGNVFAHNTASRDGGAIRSFESIITATRGCSSQKNVTHNKSDFGSNLKPCLTHFYNNTAYSGGAILITGKSSLLLNGTQIVFINNKATSNGGAIYVYGCNLQHILILNTLFEDNKADSNGGAIYINKFTALNESLNLHNIYFGRNIHTRCNVFMVEVTFEETNIIRNTGGLGGGIFAYYSIVTMEGHTCLTNNSASSGGGIYFISGNLSLNEHTLFSHNQAAHGDGGALHATDTHITMNNRINFTSNTAQNGGAMFVNDTTSLTLSQHATLTTSHNHASQYGGAIYHEDVLTEYFCSNPRRHISEKSPECFLKLANYKGATITSHIDSADRDGTFLYGGLLDKCRLNVDGNYNYSITPYDFLTKNIFSITSNKNKANQIAATSYKLMFCDDDPLHYYEKSVSISRGQRLITSIQAIGITPVQVTALPGINARVHLNQVIQLTSSMCNDLTYNFYSSQDQDELRLTTTGSCEDTGTVQLLIGVTLLPCPHPLVQNGEECVCDKRLLEYPNVNCTTDEHNNTYITKQHGTDFWMSVSYNTNGSYEGLILYKTCPPEYCMTGTVAVSMDDLDSQCDDNHGGVLCGQCLANNSLMLGSSTCTHCSHRHLALLLPFAAAGIALVVFLSFLRLTVATALINSVILYANILQANRNVIFPANERNILTVFIAWMNLDLGFETCFYDGMTAYAQTWLQFAFPLYVWILISFIILSSRYSITVSKLIGHNPIAVLATLLLMSYTKLLKIIIEVYSSVDLAYPDDQAVTVWLKDANVPYLQSWHLLLTVVTTLVLVLFFLPYTLLLLLGYKLYRFAGRRYLRWVHRIRPLLESYYAPYNIHTRYWTGFLLLVRCVLYIIFSTYSLENTSKSLLAINATFTGLLVLLLITSLCYSHLLYIKVHNNIMEIFTYLNLIILSAATIVGANSPALVYSLVGLVFVAMLGIIVYHFHLLYIAKSQVWQQFKVKVSTLKEKLTHSATNTASGSPVDTGVSAHDSHKMVTRSEIKIREPLLQEN